MVEESALVLHGVESKNRPLIDNQISMCSFADIIRLEGMDTVY